MSRKIYDYNTCYEIAKQCSCSSEMKNTNGSAYNVALKNKWLGDYSWFVKKQHKPYTYEEVYEIAKHYTCSSEFQKGNGSAYGKALANKWIKDYTWFTIKQHAPYTYQECYDIAKVFKNRRDMALGNVGAYQAALNHGWLDDYTWFTSSQKPFRYWTKERVTEESKKYKTRGEFALCNGTAYGKARINGWLDEFTWLIDDRIDFVEGEIDCVYAYEFKEFNSVYIGRTLMRRARERNYEHLFVETDAVAKFVKEHGIALPPVKILEENLTLKEGIEKEGLYLQRYKNDGWIVLNKAKAGSIGRIAKDKWTKAACHEEALKYASRGAFAEGNGSAYESARIHGWLDDYTWFEEMQKPAGYWDDFDNCYNAASKCRTKTEFIKKYNRAYVIAKKNGWLGHFTWFNIKRVAHNKKWDYDAIVKEASKYESRKEFRAKANGAYKAAIRNEWLDLVFPIIKK
ncbi:MAG: hypothetical protein IJ543_04295 [Bacteroidales bacterium]|nr:hypothetical protein [Bacteroidales bacterium]